MVQGQWKASIALNDSVDLPFYFDWIVENGDPVMVMHNADEKIVIKDITQCGDSIHLNFPVFNTSLHFLITDSTVTGTYVKNDAEEYVLPFSAFKSEMNNRFEIKERPCCSLNKRWAVTFRPGQENTYPAIAEINQQGNNVTGTFLTETGDYRYLSGAINNDSLKLAGFDGTHLYVFKAQLKSMDLLEGTIYSGRSRADKWIATRNDTFQLTDAEKLTYLKEGYGSIEFELPLTADSTLIFDSAHFNGEVVILQILGSWCGNCMDESRFLEKLYQYYQKDGLRIIGLAFERKADQTLGFKAIEKMGTDLKLTYPIGFAGSTSKKDREAKLPQLNKIMSFPTTIFIDKKGKVRKIHTGFSGPSTSVYQQHTQDVYEFVQQLLIE